MIRNIVFDMGNVLIHWCPETFIARLDVPEADRPLLLKEVFSCVEWVQLDRGVITHEEAAAAICRRLPERLQDAARTLVFDWWKRPLLPMEGMAELIHELKDLHYGIYLLSNAGLDQPRYFDRIPGSEYFDGRIISSEWKLIKPQPELFQILLQKFDLKAEECFFVDDLYINVEAAIFVGMSGTIFKNADDLRLTLIQAGIPLSSPD